jgi:hypothetical protein
LDFAGIHACLDAATILQGRGWCLFLHAGRWSVRRILETAARETGYHHPHFKRRPW